MEYRRLGKTGLKVSCICLGAMSFGTSKWQPWVLEEEASFEIIKRAYEGGINFFDTADMYSNGESERVLGKAIKRLNIPRKDVVIATKLNGLVLTPNDAFKMERTPDSVGTVNHRGLSRKHVFEAVEASLERLGTDYIDLYQIHRWDNTTPIEVSIIHTRS
jgi:aryl-alcohol dehydrogenase-like predicted oxidoreductase